MRQTASLVLLLLLTCGAISAQSVADAAKASKGSGTSKVFGEDDLESLHERSHASSDTGSANSASSEKSEFCDSGCQDEVRNMMRDKIPADKIEDILAEGLTAAREDSSWQELIGRVQASICTEKKTGSPAEDAAALQRELLLKITQEQKDIANLQETAIKNASLSDATQLKLRGAKLMVIGAGVKRMESAANCPAK